MVQRLQCHTWVHETSTGTVSQLESALALTRHSHSGTLQRIETCCPVEAFGIISLTGKRGCESEHRVYIVAHSPSRALSSELGQLRVLSVTSRVRESSLGELGRGLNIAPTDAIPTKMKREEYGEAPECKGGRMREIPEIIRRPAASSLHDSRTCGNPVVGDRTRFSQAEGEESDHHTTAAPVSHKCAVPLFHGHILKDSEPASGVSNYQLHVNYMPISRPVDKESSGALCSQSDTRPVPQRHVTDQRMQTPASEEPLRRRHDGNTARLARRSDETLGVRVSVARIAPSLLDLERAAPGFRDEQRRLYAKVFGSKVTHSTRPRHCDIRATQRRMIECKYLYTMKDISLGLHQLGSPLVDDRPIMNAVKYNRVLFGVVWTNRTKASSNTDTNRISVVAVIDVGSPLKVPYVYAARQKHCTPVHIPVRSGDSAIVERASVTLTTSALCGYKMIQRCKQVFTARRPAHPPSSRTATLLG
ncbi:hypothetical protein PR048_000136 [Dryococelus australis]|uniref:Uncharacterized protein n=1 Tax=Dryococelus australis TaxID=614101 RepID=A0ABQ9IDS6_9NEOP|nr:hypothetical protein PR048_000136 [Dryococelus australis]